MDLFPNVIFSEAPPKTKQRSQTKAQLELSSTVFCNCIFFFLCNDDRNVLNIFVHVYTIHVTLVLVMLLMEVNGHLQKI